MAQFKAQKPEALRQNTYDQSADNMFDMLGGKKRMPSPSITISLSTLVQLCG